MTIRYKEIESVGVALPVEQLIEGTVIPFDVFLKDKTVIIPLFNAGMAFTKITRNLLKEKGITEVFIKNTDVHNLEYYLSKIKYKKDVKDIIESAPGFKQYSFYKEEHYQVDKTIFVPDTSVNFSLFVLNKFSFKPVIKASDDAPAKIQAGIISIEGDLIIKKSDIERYQSYLNSLSSIDNISEENKNIIKIAAIREASRVVVKNLLENPRSGEKIKSIKIAANNLIECILENRDAIYSLLSLKGYDFYTYTHSINTAVLSIGLGIAIDLKRDEIENLGIGAILHDIGKSVVPHEILNKQGKLDGAEYYAIKQHVIEGEKILRSHKEVAAESLIPVLQHHEKLTGKGYPFKLSGKSIKLFGRIAAIADCYDAMTTQRPYKQAFTPFYALSVIVKETGDYDPDLLKIFIKMLGKIK